MVELLGLVLIAFFLTSILLVPFIDFLFYLKHQRKGVANKALDDTTPIHNKLLAGKDLDTPVGGGILLIMVVAVMSLIYAVVFASDNATELYILVLTILAFGLIGFLDDIRKIFLKFSGKYSGLRTRYILILQIIFASGISYLLYSAMGINNIFVPILGNIILGIWYIPLATLAITAFANAYNIADGLDGLAAGLLIICLVSFLVLSSSVVDPTLGIFLGIWIGTVIAYLYFNIFPARIYLGDAGAYGFGAALAVVGLLTGKILGLGVVGGVFVLILLSSLIQLLSKRFLGHKIFPVAPLHMYFKYIGWPEPKIVMRFWLVGAIFAIFGLWLALMSF